LSSLIESVAELRVSLSSLEARLVEIQQTPTEDSSSVLEISPVSQLRPYTADISEAFTTSTQLSPSALIVQALIPPQQEQTASFPTATPVPKSKWGFFIGDTVRISNAIEIGSIRVPYRFKTGTIACFTAQCIVIGISYEHSGICS